LDGKVKGDVGKPGEGAAVLKLGGSDAEIDNYVPARMLYLNVERRAEKRRMKLKFDFSMYRKIRI
jgi:hypothetical protein